MIHLKKSFSILALTILTLTSCHFNSTFINREEDKKDAQKVTAELYELLKSNNYEATVPLFSKKFLEVTNKEKLFEIFSFTKEKIGDLQDTTIEAWETNRVEGSNPSALYSFTYNNKYDKFNAKETVNLLREADGKIRIFRYAINSDGFFKGNTEVSK